jgi:hypothetical protein
MRRLILGFSVIIYFYSTSFASDSLSNFARGTMSGYITSTSISLLLFPGEGERFPTPPFNVTVWDNRYGDADPSDAYNSGHAEIMRVTRIGGDTLIVTRAQEGTLAINFNTVGKIYLVEQRITKYYLTTLSPPFIVQDTGTTIVPITDTLNFKQGFPFSIVSSGTTNRTATVTIPPVIDMAKWYELHDDFFTGSVGNNTVGTCGWGMALVGQAAQLAETSPSRVGVLMLKTNATANYLHYIYLPINGSVGSRGWKGNTPNLLWRCDVNTPDATSANYVAWCGRSAQPTTGYANATDFIGFKSDGGDWWAHCDSASHYDSVDTGVPYDSLNYHRLEFLSNSTGKSITFYIDGNLVATLTQYIPAAYLEEHFRVSTATAYARRLYIDYWQEIVTGLSR